MTTYRMPELLGGGEFEGHHYRSDPDAVGFYVEGEVVWVPVVLLTIMAPPLPEEPPLGSFVRVRSSVLHRGSATGLDWRDLEGKRWLTWAQVCELGPPVRLVPAPVVEPVTLPWEGHSIYGTPTRVRLGEDPGEVLVEYNRSSDVILSPDTADAMAAALTTAAAKARQA